MAPETSKVGMDSADVVIRTLEEWEACKGGDKTILLHMGSELCVKCPDFAERIHSLKKERQFKHVYANLYDVEEDLYEELGVTQLPAYMLVSAEETLSGQAASPEQVAEAVHRVCAAVLCLDEDF